MVSWLLKQLNGWTTYPWWKYSMSGHIDLWFGEVVCQGKWRAIDLKDLHFRQYNEYIFRLILCLQPHVTLFLKNLALQTDNYGCDSMKYTSLHFVFQTMHEADLVVFRDLASMDSRHFCARTLKHAHSNRCLSLAIYCDTVSWQEAQHPTHLRSKQLPNYRIKKKQ